MVKGYHYTKPNTFNTTNSCRLFIDNTIEEENTTVKNNSYVFNVTEENKDDSFFISINVGEYQEI